MLLTHVLVISSRRQRTSTKPAAATSVQATPGRARTKAGEIVQAGRVSVASGRGVPQAGPRARDARRADFPTRIDLRTRGYKCIRGGRNSRWTSLAPRRRHPRPPPPRRAPSPRRRADKRRASPQRSPAAARGHVLRREGMVARTRRAQRRAAARVASNTRLSDGDHSATVTLCVCSTEVCRSGPVVAHGFWRGTSGAARGRVRSAHRPQRGARVRPPCRCSAHGQCPVRRALTARFGPDAGGGVGAGVVTPGARARRRWTSTGGGGAGGAGGAGGGADAGGGGGAPGGAAGGGDGGGRRWGDRRQGNGGGGAGGGAGDDNEPQPCVPTPTAPC
jgi:hypothetical protein